MKYGYSDKIVDYITKHYGGTKTNWVRYSKKKNKQGLYIRKFNSSFFYHVPPVYVLSNDKTETILNVSHNNVPSGFVIHIPNNIYSDTIQDINNINENVEYFPNLKKDDDFEKYLPYVMVNTGDPDNIDKISNEYATLIYIERAYKTCLYDMFKETDKNTIFIKQKMSLKEIREYFENLGLVFLGYEESRF